MGGCKKNTNETLKIEKKYNIKDSSPLLFSVLLSTQFTYGQPRHENIK